MPWGVAAAAVVTAGSIYSADTQASAQQNAANTQAQAAAQQQLYGVSSFQTAVQLALLQAALVLLAHPQFSGTLHSATLTP